MKKFKRKVKTVEELSGFYPENQLDFHTFGIINNFEIEKILGEFIEDCFIQKNKNILIITGKGNIIRPLVQKLLRQNKYVENFKQAGYFNGQSGAIEVVLID